LIAIYWIFWPTFSWNQKMTVEVEVGGQIVTGSSVTRVSVSYQPRLLPEITALTRDIRGEAVDVQLPDGRHVFALLSSPDNVDYTASIAGKLFADIPHDSHGGAWTGLFSAVSRLRETRDLPLDLYPLFVTFDNIADPATVRQVDPKDFAATLGPGVALKRVTLGITDESVSEKLGDDVLGWLCEFREKGARLNGNVGAIMNNDLANNIGSGSFKTEF
jgi:hypothetical protein